MLCETYLRNIMVMITEIYVIGRKRARSSLSLSL